MTEQRRVLVCAAALAVSGLMAERATAQTTPQVNWDGGTSGSNQTWVTTTNWSPDGLPAAGNSLVFATRNGTDAMRVIGSGTLASPTGSMFMANATTSFWGTDRPSMASMIFGNDTTSFLPATLTLFNGTGTGPANQVVALTGDSDGNFISLKSSVSSTVVFDRVNSGTMSMVLNGAGVINVTNAPAVLEIETGISGSGGLNKTGLGTLYLSNATSLAATEMSYTGNVDVRAGMLRIASDLSLGATSNVTTVRDNAILAFVNSGISVTVDPARQIVLDGPNSGIRAERNTTSISRLSGTGTLNKSGTGTLNLNGSATFTGGVNVQAGTLFINTPLTSTAEITVASGATLGGNNTLSATNIRVGGTIYPGTATLIGTLTAPGNVILSNGTSAGTYRTAFSTSSVTGARDVLAVGGTFDITGGTLRIDSLNSAGDASYVLASYGTLAGGTFANITGLVGGYTLDYNFGGQKQIALVRGNTRLFFNGSSTAEFANASNFTTDAAGTLTTTQTPTASADVTFASNGLSNAGNYATTVSATTYVNSLTFANAAPTGISQLNAGTGSLVIRAAGINSAAGTGIVVNSGAGAVTIATPVTPSSSQTWTNNSANALAVTGNVTVGASVALTLAGTGSTSIGGVVSGSGGITVAGAGAVSLTGANTYTGVTTVNKTGAVLTVKYVSPGTATPPVVSAATPLLSGAGADIQNGSVVFDYAGDTTLVAGIRTILAGSFTAGAGVMNTGQLRSTTASATRGLGYADTGTTVIVKAVLFGDADLDGGVSINDFNALAGNFGQATGKVWTDGDFDYDGGVSINDFNLLAGGFGQTLPVTSEMWAGLLAFAAANNDLAAFEAVTGVPEPTSLGLLAAGATLALRRRRSASVV